MGTGSVHASVEWPQPLRPESSTTQSPSSPGTRVSPFQAKARWPCWELGGMSPYTAPKCLRKGGVPDETSPCLPISSGLCLATQPSLFLWQESH